MRRRQALPVAVAALAVTAGPLAGYAWADRPETVTATFQQLAPPAPIAPPKVTGKATHLLLADRTLIAGDVLFTPPGAEAARTEYRCVIIQGKATFRCRGEGTATARVAGVGTGEIVSKLNFTCTSISPEAALCQGRIRLKGVSGDLAGVRLTGTFENTGVPGQSTSTLRLHRH